MHLRARRGEILREWRRQVDADAELTTASTLSRAQFLDHIPALLDDFEVRLCARPGRQRDAADAEIEGDAAAHGMHRWQQGYHLREVTREWGHLQLCLVDELEHYAALHAGHEGDALPTARRALARLFSDGVSESAAQYFHLRQTEAAAHVADLEQALVRWQQLERQRAEGWREAAHDLRGNVGLVKNVSAVLGQDVPEPMRARSLQMLQRGVASLQSLLEDVLSLARLQAGHEQPQIGSFDAGELLGQLVAQAQPLAKQRGLHLAADGPSSLPVAGDRVKVQRIVQNLLLNALHYTERGTVSVQWGDSRDNDPKRWMIVVRDSGPGFDSGGGAPLADALKGATRESRAVETAADPELPRAAAAAAGAAAKPAAGPAHRSPGEGIGLSIVKQLCELLDASLELDSEPGRGSTFRVILPRDAG